MPSQRVSSSVVPIVAGVLVSLVPAGCGSPPGTPATAGKALDHALRMMYSVRQMVDQGHFDVAAERAYDVTRHLTDGRLNDVAGIQAIRDDWKTLRSDLGRRPPPEDLAERLDALIDRLEPLAAAAQGSAT